MTALLVTYAFAYLHAVYVFRNLAVRVLNTIRPELVGKAISNIKDEDYEGTGISPSDLRVNVRKEIKDLLDHFESRLIMYLYISSLWYAPIVLVYTVTSNTEFLDMFCTDLREEILENLKEIAHMSPALRLAFRDELMS